MSTEINTLELIHLIWLKTCRDKTKSMYGVVIPAYYARQASQERLAAGRDVGLLQEIIKKLNHRLLIISLAQRELGSQKSEAIDLALEDIDSKDNIDAYSAQSVVEEIVSSV